MKGISQNNGIKILTKTIDTEKKSDRKAKLKRKSSEAKNSRADSKMSKRNSRKRLRGKFNYCNQKQVVLCVNMAQNIGSK